MKSDRAGRFGAVLLVLTGLGALLVGCASLSPPPEDDLGSQRPGSPDPPLEIVGAPDRAVATPDIEHLPVAPHLDLPWRTAAPIVPVVQDRTTSAAATPAAPTPAPAEPAAILEPPVAPAPVAGPASLRTEGGGVSEAPVSGLTLVPVPSPPAAFREKPELVLHPPPALPAALSSVVVDPTATGDGGSLVAGLDDVPLPERHGVAAEETLPPADVALPEHRDAADAGDVSVGSKDTEPLQDTASDDRVASSESDAAWSSAPVTQPAAPAATPGRAPREDTSGERRVNPGRPFEVALPGRGWVYLGGGDELQFLDRTTREGDVVFSFRGPAVDAAPGEPTTLEFESQDLATGRRTRHEERVLVAEGGDSGSGRNTGPADANAAGEGANNAGEDAESGEEVEAAGAGEGTADEDPAGAGGVPADLSQADYEELLVRVDGLEAAGEHREAVEILEAMRREGIGRDDELIMRLAQLYESEWSGRNLPQARELYYRLVDNYPFSRWRRPARERIEYLNRHFFHIR